MINKATIIGNLGADPEVTTAKSGLTICKLRIATNERRKNSDTGDWEDHTEWHRVTCFGKTAENCGKYLAKGRQVYVEGPIRTSKWQDSDGNDRWSTEIIGNNVKFLSGGSQERSSQAPSRQQGKTSSYNAPDDDIPF